MSPNCWPTQLAKVHRVTRFSIRTGKARKPFSEEYSSIFHYVSVHLTTTKRFLVEGWVSHSREQPQNHFPNTLVAMIYSAAILASQDAPRVWIKEMIGWKAMYRKEGNAFVLDD